MKYGIYRAMNFEYARHGIPERLIGTIDANELKNFIVQIKKAGYIGHFFCNKGHYRERVDWSQRASIQIDLPEIKELHIIPYKGPDYPISDWEAIF